MTVIITLTSQTFNYIMGGKQVSTIMAQRSKNTKVLSSMKRGSKIIDLSIDGNVETWIRNEKGEKEIQGKVSSKGTKQTICSKH